MGQQFIPGVHPRPFKMHRDEFTQAEREHMERNGWTFCAACGNSHATSCTNSHNLSCKGGKS